ncbi:MAG: penicillin-binding protein activator LpoB [Planctomycetes bacterium]|jgi:PBP1b-binding outer membrane lipoprotein LpoB|nr:penicillin-binding protein activator LpoB [Planctomycetota bacterium]
MRPFIATALVLLLPTSLALTTGCGGKTVNRTDENAVIDLSGNWNATDSRMVADALIADCLEFPWADQFKVKNNRIPVVKTGRIKVVTNGDVVNTEIFTNDLQRALLRSGKAQPVASNSETDQAREERKDQDVNASETTRKESFQETGSDFLIIGTINVQDDQEGGTKQKFYSVDLKMTDVKTQQQVWIGNKKISKLIKR